MSIKGQIQWTDYLQAQLLHMKSGKLMSIFLYGILSFFILIFLGGAYLAISGKFDFLSLTLPLIFVGAFLLYRYYLLPRQVRKIFFQQKELSSPFEIEINEEGLKFSNEYGNSLRPWDHYTKWKENNELILLYHSDLVYSIIPKRFVTDPSQIEKIKNYLINYRVPLAKARSRFSCVIYFILIIAIVWMFYQGFHTP
jgi:hypothetical protein